MSNYKFFIALFLLQISTISFASNDYIPISKSQSCKAFTNLAKIDTPKIFESTFFRSKEEEEKKVLLDCEVARGNTTKNFKNISLARTNIGDRYTRHGYKYAALQWYESAFWYDKRELKKGKYTHISSSAYKLGVIKKSIDEVDEAFNHFLLSAKRGYSPAQYEVGLAYMHGLGAIKNYVEAYAWFNITASNHKGSKSKQSKEQMDALEPKMTPASVEKAQSLSKQYKQETSEIFSGNKP